MDPEEPPGDLLPAQCLPSSLVNAILVGYQLTVRQALGRGASAITHLLIRSAEEFYQMVASLDPSLQRVEDPVKDIPRIFEKLGISTHVEVEKEDGIYTVKIYDSAFSQAIKYLTSRGIEFTLSPEVLLAAGVVARYQRSVRGDVRLRVTLRHPHGPGEPLEIIIQEGG